MRILLCAVMLVIFSAVPVSAQWSEIGLPKPAVELANNVQGSQVAIDSLRDRYNQHMKERERFIEVNRGMKGTPEYEKKLEQLELSAQAAASELALYQQYHLQQQRRLDSLPRKN